MKFYQQKETSMIGGKQLIDRIEMDLGSTDDRLRIYIDIWDHSLSRKWLKALNELLNGGYHLEKNYCFFGFADGPRTPQYILDQINGSIEAINRADIGYQIDDYFTMENSVEPGLIQYGSDAGRVNHDKFNNLHRYFEDLQGVSGRISPYYDKSSPRVRWHIRQLNLLCHEFESLMLSVRKKILDSKWQRPSQLMCWLNAPRFVLEDDDYEMFGVESINRPLGGVYVGVNKAVGKHHWEVFVDEANYDPDFIADNLTTTVLKGQTEATGDFDIEWANDPGQYDFQKKHLSDFRIWLSRNGFDPDDKTLTIGHPQVGQVDLMKSFGTTDYNDIWKVLSCNLNVVEIRTGDARCSFDYHWADPDYDQQQIDILTKGK
jgi:hypothetical protein